MRWIIEKICEEHLMLLILLYSQQVSLTFATDLSSWCASQGARAYYLGQSCFTLTSASKSYVDSANICTEQKNGALAILATTDVIQGVTKNLLQNSTGTQWFIAYVQLPQSNPTSKGQDWFWVDAQNNTYGQLSEIQWNPGEPDDLPVNPDGLDHNHQNCGVIHIDGILSDKSCTSYLMPAICQYKDSWFNYQPINIGNKVKSTSTAKVSGKTEISIFTTEICGIMCKSYGSCRGFSINKALITCTLLYKYNLNAADLISHPDYEIYGLY